MSELPYRPADELATAARVGLNELFGADTYTSRLLLGSILGDTTLDGLGVIDMAYDAQAEYGVDSEPRYAERAIRTNNPTVLWGLLEEAASRLENVIPAEWITTTPEGAKRLFAEYKVAGGTDEVIGGLHILLSPAKSAEDMNAGHNVAKLEYVYDDRGSQPPSESTRALVARLSIFQRLLTDPVTSAQLVSLNAGTAYTLYRPGHSSPYYFSFGLVAPIDAKIKAELFFSLDKAITFYEAHAGQPAGDTQEWVDDGLLFSYQLTIDEYLRRLQDIIEYESASRRSIEG